VTLNPKESEAMFKTIPTTLALLAALATSTPALAAPEARVYIPTGDAAEVVVVDTRTHTQIGRIADLPAAHGLAVTPDGQRLVVGSFDVLPVGGAAAPDRPAGVSAEDHAAHHAPATAPAAADTVSDVSIVDIATGSVIRRIEVPGAVHHVAVSPDGRTAVVTHPARDAITAIDLGGLTVIATVPTGSLPNYAAFSADGGRLYVSNSGEDTVAVLDIRSWTATDRIAVGESPEHLVLSPDGRRLVVANVISGSLTVIDVAEGRVVATLPVGNTPHGLDFADDGNTVYVALTGEDRLAAVDLVTGSARSAPLAPAPYHLSAIRGRGVLYVSSAEAPRIWVINAATQTTLAEIALPGTGHQFAQMLAD
jgi:YVTN family beta-propeller protein